MAACDHCGNDVEPDTNGYWTGDDDVSDCPVSANGHAVNGRIR